MEPSSKKGKKYSKVLMIVDADRCTGCGVCELVCSMAKLGEYNPKKSHIRIMRNDEFDTHIPVIQYGNDRCDLCGECVRACPTGVIRIVKPEEAILARRKSSIGTIPVPVVTRVEM